MAQRQVEIQPEGSVWQVRVDGRQIRVSVVRHRRARRYILRLREDGGFQVTMPPRGTYRAVREFLKEAADWMLKVLAARPGTGQELKIGEKIPLRGRWVFLERDPKDPRWVCFGDQRIEWKEGGAGKPSLREVLTVHLQQLARKELPPRVRQYAAVYGLEVRGIRIGDQRTRWGSCSAKGRISLNWRLILMPPFVRDYLILHELTHLRVPGHGADFRKELERMCPYWRAAEMWIRKEGQGLLWLFPPGRVGKGGAIGS